MKYQNKHNWIIKYKTINNLIEKLYKINNNKLNTLILISKMKITRIMKIMKILLIHNKNELFHNS